ncbi:thioredoxin family protein [Celerinatantimonas sp. MCCC 1A17872]|uniref:thioredoxin family protein n=1 Tax=Celerinatantimonas sp. MCCC 1A17872 TaxID=3177514 RepID=UPI0038CAA919
MKVSRNKVRSWSLATLAALVAILACGYIYVFHVKSYGVSASDGWYFEDEGYRQALAISQQQNRPILFYFRRKACQICKDFEKNIINNADFIHFTRNYIKVRYTIDLDQVHQRFAKKYPIRMQPALIVQYQRHPPVSTHLVLPMNQIWVAKNSIDNGNHMPLSITTLKLSLQRVTEIAKRKAMADGKN